VRYCAAAVACDSATRARRTAGACTALPLASALSGGQAACTCSIRICVDHIPRKLAFFIGMCTAAGERLVRRAGRLHTKDRML